MKLLENVIGMKWKKIGEFGHMLAHSFLDMPFI